MENLFKAGRLFYGIGITGIGLQTIYYHHLPYILSLPKHFPMPGQVALAFILGILFTLAGAGILLKKNPRQISLVFGGVLLLLFCFYYIPYEFLTSANYMQLEDWENAEKELTLAGGAFVLAGCFPKRNESQLTRFLGKLIPLGAILFSITMIGYGILHFKDAKEASAYIPAWIPNHLFWMYFCGVALIGSGIAIILKIKVKLIAALLGTMIFIWFIVLHIPRVVVSPAVYLGSEIFSAFLALAYSGTAFVIAGSTNKKAST